MRLIKTALALPITLIALSFLGGCNGSSDDTSCEETTGEYAISLSYKNLVNGQCTDTTSALSFPSNVSICAVAKLTQGGRSRCGGLINFSASLGTISPTTKLTNSSGLAEVILAPDADTQGAGTVTAEFDTQADENNLITANRNYEFVDSGGTSSTNVAKISASIQLGAITVTQFKVDETVQLQAQFLDASSIGIAGQLTTFTAGSATLTPDTALTNEQGIAQISFTPTESELGATNLNVALTYQGQSFQSNSLYEVLSIDAIGGDGVLKLGHFGEDNQFIEGQLATTLALTDGKYIISAGGNLGVTATLISQANDGTITRVQTPSSISFSSDCVSSSNASIDTPVTTLSGDARSTFQDTSCSGNSERDDIISASTLAGNQTLTANLLFTLERQTLANISFVSAEPTNIRIKGAGGTDSTESSLVTFKVTSANGQPTAQQEVNFSLDTVVGGLSFANGLSTAEGLTNSAGIVSVRILSSTVPTPVRVVASAKDSSTNKTITTQSELLTVNTGLPQQLGFSISSAMFNPEANDSNGETTSITAYASDNFGNPAPDDTVVQFTAEGGQIESNCTMVNGMCSVVWTSANPRVTDHRITILAYALGHETFFDTNGNNIFDESDGAAVDACLTVNGILQTCSGNGMDIETYVANGFNDLPDAFRDDNENFTFDAGERYFNTQANTTYGSRDSLFNGPQCEGSLCGKDQANKIYIRKALVMVMSGSTARFIIKQGNTKVFDSTDGTNITLSAIAAGASSGFSVQFFDSAGQIMPANSNLSVSINNGTLDFSPYSVKNTISGKSDCLANISDTCGSTTVFTLTNNIDPTSTGEPSQASNITIELITPNEVKSSVVLTVELTGT
ncbi:Ig-like domain-containing protein [Shewanella sp. VB17]|uniref:Ig-like domain-containing protein n=1 Tax=Shewanella sp. VB17 TaxID=2739432 RepID=UPI0015647734|nr:Ig-like domain-containing protein [Shewanella sp. VB17]NRD72497.1 Ig-like domain-containing protein [Shewanella sp. VB17]